MTSVTVTIPITDDGAGEPLESFSLLLSNATAGIFLPAGGSTATIVIVDDPTVTVPAPIVVDATSTAGAIVTFTATAAGHQYQSLTPVTCSPSSGSTFPTGTTTVTCSATDQWQQTGSASFTVTVRSAAEQTAALLTVLAAIPDASPGLTSKLETVESALAAGNTNAACGSLEAFTNQVSAQSGKSLTVAEANALIAAATRVMAANGC